MKKEEVVDLIKKNKDSYPQIIKAYHKNFYEFISINFIGKKFSEKLYRWLHNDNKSIGICKKCNENSTKFMSFIVGFNDFCCRKCSNQYTIVQRTEFLKKKNERNKHLYWIEKKCLLCNKNFFSLIKRNQLFCSNKCSAQFTGNDLNRLKKIKKTKKEKYGDEIFVNSEKAKQTCLEKYGVDNASKSDEIKNKIRDIAKKRFFAKLSNHKLNNMVVPLFDLNTYKNTDKINQYKFKCKKCNDEFLDHIDGGHLPRCLKCYPYITTNSNAEKEVKEFIKELLPKEELLIDNRCIIPPLELDIYIPSLKLAIEYNGLYWHSELGGKKDKNYHLDKTNKCKELGIRLIHIFEDEWIYKQTIVKNRLQYILEKSNYKTIYARHCNIKEIEDCSEFLDENHIQGNYPASIKIGAYYQNKLVAVMTFGHLRICLGSNKFNVREYELIRYVTSGHIVGISSKLLNYFIKNYNPTKIISYADKRWSVGNLYEKIGFKLIGETSPNYWYFYKGEDVRRHRFSFRKDQLAKKLEMFDPSLTEWENMQLNGYDRIWDCGSLKYEMILVGLEKPLVKIS